MILPLAMLTVLSAACLAFASTSETQDPDIHRMHSSASLTERSPESPGQSAWGAIAEIVQMLEEDPTTDWSRVNINALRAHLIDMDEVILNASVTESPVENGLEFTVSGEGRTIGAIQRLVPAHAAMMRADSTWETTSRRTGNGIVLTVTSAREPEVRKIGGLGFFGFMVLGRHHTAHHLAIARGTSPH